MGKDMKNTGNHADLRTQSEAHVNISNLGHTGKGDHPSDIIFLYSTQGAEYHPHEPEYEEYVDYLVLRNKIKADYPVNNLDQQKNITLGNQAGKHGRRRYGGIAIGIRQPGVKGKQGAFYGKAHAD